MAPNPRPVEPVAVDEIDFRQGVVQRPAEEEVPPVPSRPESIAGGPYGELPPEPDADEPRRGPWRTVLLGFLAVCALVGVVWLAYQWGLETGHRIEVPTIVADATPIKTKPESPGGLVVPDQDKLVLNEPATAKEEPRVERLLSAPEAPAPMPRAEQPPQGTGTAAADGEAGGVVATPPAGAAQESGMGVSASEAVIKAEEQDPAPSAEEVPAPPAAPPQVAEAPSPAQAPAPPPTPSAAETAAETTAPAVGGGGGGGSGSDPTGVQVAAIDKGDYVIQLAAVGSDDAARKEWGRIQRSFPNLLGDMALSVQQVEVKGKTYHRIQTGPFPSRATAQDMCAQLKSQKQACIVQRR